MDKQDVVYTYNGILFSLKKKWRSNIHYNIEDIIWMKLEDIIWSEMRQMQEDKYCMISLIWDTWNS